MDCKIPQSEMIAISKLKPYATNAKKHNSTQIANVAQSIRQFGFVQPFVVDKDNSVVIGHCRLLAAQQLGIKELPCVRVDYLTKAQIKALRILDNKLNESEWDLNLLTDEILELDMSEFNIDFDLVEDNQVDDEKYEVRKREFEERMASGELSEDSEEYQEFLAKFEPKKTTDDCYTPSLVYDAVADYVSQRYGVSKNNFVRPFVPNGDYQSEIYQETDIVVDNPPFSILSQIVEFYNNKGIRYFLFAPHLTLFSSKRKGCLATGVTITYENGANVCTSFLTNLENCVFRTAPILYNKIKIANDKNLKQTRKQLPKYSYPLSVITAPMLTSLSRYGINFEVSEKECYFTRQLDSQKEKGCTLFGAGYLISERKTAEREKAEREKAEREKAERWELSARELDIVMSLK